MIPKRAMGMVPPITRTRGCHIFFLRIKRKAIEPIIKMDSYRTITTSGASHNHFLECDSEGVERVLAAEAMSKKMRRAWRICSSPEKTRGSNGVRNRIADIPKKFKAGGMPQLSSHLNTVLSRSTAIRADKIKEMIGEGPKTR